MKVSDNYQAKYRLWAEQPEVRPLPKPVGIPRFHSRKFSSYEEMNAWKRELLKQIAAGGGCQWTS